MKSTTEMTKEARRRDTRSGAALLRRYHSEREMAEAREKRRRERRADTLIALTGALVLALAGALAVHVWCNLDETFLVVCVLGVVTGPVFLAAVFAACLTSRR